MTRFYPQPHDSAAHFSLGRLVNCARKKAGRNDVCTVEPALNNHAFTERSMSLIPTKPGIYPAQATPTTTYDGISARDDFLRREMERGSEELLRAMIREMESMGVLA